MHCFLTILAVTDSGQCIAWCPERGVWCHLCCCSTSSTPCPSCSLSPGCHEPPGDDLILCVCICAYGIPTGIGGYGAGHTEGSHYCCTLITSTDMWLCHHGAFPIPIVFIRTRSIWPSLTHALVDAMSCTPSCWPWTQMPFSSCSPRLSSSTLCWPLPLQERGSRNIHIFPTSRCTLLYVPVLGLSIVHRIGQHSSPLVHILMGKVSVLFHPWWILFNFSIKMISLGKMQQRFGDGQ